MTRTMVLVHGGFVGGWCWKPFAQYFEVQGWRCLLPDLRHHRAGAALDQLGRTSLLDYVNDLAALIRTLEEPPVLVGHSLGGLLCQKLAGLGLGRALILLAPSPSWGILPSSRFELEARLALLGSGPFWARAVRARPEIAMRHALDRLRPSDRDAVFERFVPKSGRVLFEVLFWHLDLRHASAVTRHQVRCPILCLVGDGDRITPPATVRASIRKFPGRARLGLLKGHSHFLFGEPGFDRIPVICDSWLRAELTLASH